jgi:hypothetical protein
MIPVLFIINDEIDWMTCDDNSERVAVVGLFCVISLLWPLVIFILAIILAMTAWVLLCMAIWNWFIKPSIQKGIANLDKKQKEKETDESQ